MFERLALIAAVVFSFAVALASLYTLIPERNPESSSLPPTEVTGGTWKTW
jgi:hypothetical protein